MRLIEMLGADASELAVDVTPPAIVMMVGLQGSGKTTSTAKIAKRLADRERKKVLMASLDVARPPAQEQLAVLGRQAGVSTCRSCRAAARRASPAAPSSRPSSRAMTC
jgi:signal recognition particle subunit SRP54